MHSSFELYYRTLSLEQLGNRKDGNSYFSCFHPAMIFLASLKCLCQLVFGDILIFSKGNAMWESYLYIFLAMPPQGISFIILLAEIFRQRHSALFNEGILFTLHPLMNLVARCFSASTLVPQTSG